MKKFIFALILILFMPLVYAEDLSYVGSENVNSDMNEADKTFESLMGGKNVLVVTSGNSTFKNCTFNKKGDSTYAEADLYGTNAAVIISGGALNLDGGSVSTDGKHASGIFLLGNGEVNLNNVLINSLNDFSSGLVSSNGGIIDAKNVTLKTNGINSPAVNLMDDAGKIVISGGMLETNGKGSPILSLAGNVQISGASLVSTASEGIIIDKNGSISLTNTKLFDTNNVLSNNVGSYKNILMYQSGDRDDMVESSFTAKDSKIETNKGDTFVVTNTKALITLENNEYVNNSGAFLVVRADNYGTIGSNGGKASLSMIKQKIKGKVVVDSISSLNLEIKDGSILEGSINNADDSKNVTVDLSIDSIWSLSNDSYIKSLKNGDKYNKNIYSNGYRLYVDGKEVSINDKDYQEKTNSGKETYTASETEIDNKNVEGSNYNVIIILSVVALGIFLVAFYFIKKAKENNSF